MSKALFEGLVDMVINTKGEVALKRADSGAYSNKDADALWSDMLVQVENTGCKINTYSFYNTAELNKAERPYKESECKNKLTYDNYGNPKLIHFIPHADTSNTKRVQVLDRITKQLTPSESSMTGDSLTLQEFIMNNECKRVLLEKSVNGKMWIRKVFTSKVKLLAYKRLKNQK